MKKLSLAFAAVAILWGLSTGMALADPKWEHGGKSKHERSHDEDRHHGRDGDGDWHHGRVEMRIDVDRDYDHIGHYFREDRREAYRSYAHRYYSKRCPPGLAKKHNGCLPPGHAKRYIVGEVLDEPYYRPTTRVVELLGPPPSGAYYVMVDRDVLLISSATKKILDAVTLLSAVQ